LKRLKVANFLLGIQQTGLFKIYLNVEALP